MIMETGAMVNNNYFRSAIVNSLRFVLECFCLFKRNFATKPKDAQGGADEGNATQRFCHDNQVLATKK